MTAAEAIREMRDDTMLLTDERILKWVDAIEAELAAKDARLAEHEKRNAALCHLILEAQGANKREEPLDWWLDSAMGWLKEYRDKESA